MTVYEPQITPARDHGVSTNRTVFAMATLASAAAGLVHAAAAGTHSSDRTLALLFAATAALQLGWAAVGALRPIKAVALVGVAMNTVFVLAWLLTRTTGLPVIESLREVEPVGTQDLISAILGAAAAVGAGLSLLLLPQMSRRTVAGPSMAAVVGAGVLVLGLAVPGMAAEHTHGGSGHDDHGSTEVAAGDGGHDHTTGTMDGMDHGATAAAADDHSMPGMDHGNGPRITSLDDPKLTAEQRQKAQVLLDTTLKGLGKFTDQASVEAAGYETINDSVSGFEHFIQHSYLNDGKELDPDHIEAIVFETPAGKPKKLAAAMYILETGKTMKDAPEIAGSLTTWHMHDDLCYDDAGKTVVGLFRNGKCFPRGTLSVSAPMLHIWKETQRCGPFAEADLLENPVDKFLNKGVTTTTAPGTDPCAHVHNGGASAHTDTNPAAPTTGAAAPAAGGHQHGAIPARFNHEPTDAQKADARKLIEDTKRDTAKYADVEAAKAAGYQSIGDSITGVEHYVNAAFYADKDILKTDRIESLVYKVEGAKRTLITAMYIMPEGTTEADIPDVAGTLTLWHNHQNLCWRADDPSKLAGIQINGKCTAGVYHETPQMLHVWVTENPCGPFAGTDGGQMTGSCVKDF